MTGWDRVNARKFGKITKSAGCYTMPIVPYKQYHDKTAKTVLGTTIPAGQTQTQDIESLLNILMANKNIAPNISKRLIQKLTTSNPSASYIKRVAEVFNDDGTGTKGNLKAVVKAILLDKEVRGTPNKNSGKADELLTALVNILTIFNVQPTSGWKFYGSRVTSDKPLYWINSGDIFSQAVLSADDVFNFYDANYAPNDTEFLKNNLVAPELQIQTSNNLIKFSRYLETLLNNDKYYLLKIKGNETMQKYMDNQYKNTSQSNGYLMYVDLTNIYELFNQEIDGNKDGKFENLNDKIKLNNGLTLLINHLDNKMLGRTLPEDYKTKLIEELKKITGFGNKLHLRARNIIVTAIVSIAISPYNMIIR
jgi:hypothetical protein